MKIQFNGILEKRTKGCSVCGLKRRSRNTFVVTKTYILPSGAKKTFHAGMAVEVSKEDAEFLLTYHYLAPDGTDMAVFEVVS